MLSSSDWRAARHTNTHTTSATNSLSGCARLRCGCCRRQSWGERRVSRGAARTAVPGRARCPSPRCSQVCLQWPQSKDGDHCIHTNGVSRPNSDWCMVLSSLAQTTRGEHGTRRSAHTTDTATPSLPKRPQKCVRLLVTLELCNHAALRLLMGLTDILASSSARAGSKGRAEGRGGAERARS